MDRLKTASDLLKLAEILTADDYKYIYDPDHKKHPGGGYQKTEKGWQKGKQEKQQKKNNTKKPQQYIPPKATVNGDSVEEAYDKQDWNLGNGSYIREFLKDESIFKSKSFLNKAKEIAQAMKNGKTDFSDMELEDAFINVAKRVKSQYATLHTTKEDGGSDYATVGYMMGLRALDPNYNPYINEKPKAQEKPQSSSPSPVKPKGVRKNFLQRIEKAIQKGDTLSFRYTKKDGTVEKLAIKPVVVFEVGGKTAVRGFKNGIEDKDHIRMVYISSMGGDKPYIPAKRKKMLQDFNEDQLVKLSQSKKIGDFELDYMAGHKSDAVRASAAKHPNCSAGTLQKLSKDRNEAVLHNVASNPSANSYVLDKLARNPHIKEAETYMRIARNPNVSVETVNQLSLHRSVNSDITNEWSSKMPKVKNPFRFSQEFISSEDHAESGRNLATLFEARDYKVAGKAKGKTPQELKADFIANMNPSNYASMESFKKAEQRIKKMSPSDLQAMFAAIMDEEEE